MKFLSNKQKAKLKSQLTPSNIVGNIVVWVSAFLCLFPFYWALTSSFKTERAVFSIPPQWIPEEPTIEAYVNLYRRTNLGQWTFNSFFVSIMTVLLICVFACMAGYAFAHIPFKGKKLVFAICIAMMLLPKYVMLIPLYRLVDALGWMDTYQGLIIPEVASALPFGIFMVRQFMIGIPREIFESARIDGCGQLRIFSSMALPLSKPAIASLGILMFVRSWNDYMWQLIVVSSDAMRTLPLGLATLQSETVKIYSQILAGAMVSAAPLILVFILFQKHFVRGVANGAVKG